MHRITIVGNGSILLDGDLLNLKVFKDIKKEYFGLQTQGGKDFSISFTPITPTKENIENGVEGTWQVTYIGKKGTKKDSEVIQESIKD